MPPITLVFYQLVLNHHEEPEENVCRLDDEVRHNQDEDFALVFRRSPTKYPSSVMKILSHHMKVVFYQVKILFIPSLRLNNR